ncbi:Aminobenzoyl-glutamate utilization protein B [Pleurostoma richardsiae]|uniref:Aminobenzoyl-glutamate utilization protein B n=1 Tax=Pleurostoma richardsiae TaxID=41990 RepID=A0AA38RBL2_9PEZI|nr:Aminobenzoyl-glutamate utilization protein B [Pleurostoma richardsiae]
MKSTLLCFVALSHAADVSTLPTLLSSISSEVFPSLRAIAIDIWKHPEIGLDEHHAHDLVVDYFTKEEPGLWAVTPHAYGMATSWELNFENRPAGTPPDAELPVLGFMAEYDALVGIGHACGHNHIVLNGLAAATMARQALIDLGIPAQLKVMGTPDEENMCGKHTLVQAGAFDGVDVWFMAHPTSTSAIQPMNARLNAITAYKASTHADTVRAAYQAMVAVRDLVAAGLPATASSAVPIEDVGMFECNVVQGQISLGVAGLTAAQVNQTVASILDSTYPNVTYTVAMDADGVNLTSFGPGGHASESSKGPLVLTIETFRALSGQSGVSFYLPGNTSVTELDITFDVRTRYSTDIDTVFDAVTSTVEGIASSVSQDVPYLALEVTPYVPDLFINLMKSPDYGSQTDWAVSTTAPASTDAGWVQGAVGICENDGLCAFNHEPPFRNVSGTEYSYSRTEVVARAQAHLAVQLLNDPGMMANATAIIRK